MIKKYDEYRKVDAFGIKELPSHWNIKRGFSYFYENTEKNTNADEKLQFQFKYGTIVPKKDQDDIDKDVEKYKKYTVIQPNDIAINGLNLNYDFVSQRIAAVKDRGIITSAYLIFRPRRMREQKYLVYLLKGYDGIKLFHGIGSGLRQTLTSDEVLKLQLPVPPKEEQDKIVRYLDWKTSEIDRFVHQKKKQIKKLEELRKKKIDEIVTFGLDKKVNTKLTKAKWMGEVPTYWNEYRLKNLFREINVRSEQGLEPHLSMSQKKGLVTDDEDIERRLLSESYAGAKICEKDDLVLNRLKAHLGVFALSPIKGIVSPDYTVLRLNDKVIPKYLEYLLKSNACRGELTVRVRGIVEGFWRLYTEDLGAIPICIPSIEEQKDILNEIIVIDGRVDKLIKAVQEELELIMEYRTKIIADVVTGQIDVRNVVISEYSRDEDTNSDDIEDDEEIEESED